MVISRDRVSEGRGARGWGEEKEGGRTGRESWKGDSETSREEGKEREEWVLRTCVAGVLENVEKPRIYMCLRVGECFFFSLSFPPFFPLPFLLSAKVAPAAVFANWQLHVTCGEQQPLRPCQLTRFGIS